MTDTYHSPYEACPQVTEQAGEALKQQGTQVEQGESVGLMDGEHDLTVELWDGGQFVNPEEVIVW